MIRESMWTACVLLLACGSSDTKGVGSDASAGTDGAALDGGTDGSATGSGDCPGVTALLCDRAAACTGGGRVVISAAASTAEHNSAGDCKNYYAFLQCPSMSVDWAACKLAVEGATCAASSKGNALPIPAGRKGLTL